MSQKQPKPTLTGQRIKTRKRDEKAKYDPESFADQVIAGLNETGADLEQASKFLVATGSKLDYRTYAEPLLDILIAGGMLAPGGTIVDDGGNKQTSCVCIFKTEADSEKIKLTIQVFSRLIRQYKYLERILEDEMKKVLLFLKGFTEEQRKRLAIGTAIFMVQGMVPPTVFSKIFSDHLVKDGIALEFATAFFGVWFQEKDLNSLIGVLKKAEVDGKLLVETDNYPFMIRVAQQTCQKYIREKGVKATELFPVNKRSEEAFETYFNNQGMPQIVEYQHAQYVAGLRKELKEKLKEMITHEASPKELVGTCKEYKEKHSLHEHEVCLMVWKAVMNSVEWNKKEELVADQALKHLKIYAPVLAEFSNTSKSELLLIQRIQEYCYDNMNFMKVFQKIILLFYKMDVLGEDIIIKWYKEAHVTKGKSVFLQQMQKMVEWLQNAEEESSEEEG